MEIKILCHCGVKYKFDVEPVHGRVPVPVNCPACGVDATESANAYLRQLIGQTAPAVPVAAAPAAIPALAAPAPTAAPVAVAARPTAVATPQLRIQRSAQPEAPAEAPPAAGAESPPPAPARPPIPRAAAYTAALPLQEREMGAGFFMGILGGVLGAVVGCVIWYLIFHFTGNRVKFMAIFVGVTAGFGAKLLSRDEGSSQLGLITATFTLVAIVLSVYVIGRERTFRAVEGVEQGFYEARVDYAKRAVAAAPTGSEAEIRAFLAREEAEEDETPNPQAVSADEVEQFR